MTEILGIAGTGIALALALAFVRSGFLERRFSYAPVRELQYSPSDVGVAYEDVWMESADGVPLHGWFMPGERDVTFLWLHGNGGNVAYHLLAAGPKQQPKQPHTEPDGELGQQSAADFQRDASPAAVEPQSGEADCSSRPRAANAKLIRSKPRRSKASETSRSPLAV